MRTLTIMLALALVLSVGAVAQEYIMNGDFESSSDGWLFGGGMAIQGAGAWSIPFTPGGTESEWAGLITSWGASAATAEQMAFAENGNYTLSFAYYLGAHHAGDIRVVDMQVFFNDVVVFNQSQNSTGGWAGDFAWQFASIPVTVTGDIGKVNIQMNSHWAEWSWLGVDDVSLTPVVPEPASMLALGAGLVGLLGFRRRK